MWKTLIIPRVWLPFVIFGMGTGLVMYFIGNKPEARKRLSFFQGTLVEVARAERTSPRIKLETHGRVRAAQRVVLTAQVNGVVNWISPLLEEGSFFQEGDLLITLAPLNSANLDYTLVKAPFNGVVQVRSVDLGQNVNTGTQLASLIGSDRAVVLSDVPVGRLDWLMGNEARSADEAPNRYALDTEISMHIGTERAIWQGRVKRHLLELTPNGMMVQLILIVEDPFRLQPSGMTKAVKVNLRDEQDPNPESVNKLVTQLPKNEVLFERMPLFIGAFVDVSIPGRILEEVVELPVQALRDENTVWIVREGLLEIRKVEIVHLEGNFFYVSKGVEAGEQIVTSPLKGAANGLKVRLPGSKPQDVTAGRQKKKSPGYLEPRSATVETKREPGQKKQIPGTPKNEWPRGRGEGRHGQRQNEQPVKTKEEA